MITRNELIKKYIEFFEKKNHKKIPNSSLVPENDPTVLFTTAGMHPLVPFLLGQNHPLGKRLVGVQKCIRTGDIEEVGDETHHTFFEMLGNWSLGDYWKKEAIEYSFEFLTKELKIPKEKLAVSVFAGDKNFSKIKKDEESAKIWISLGISNEKIVGITNNWWGPAGKTGPCGPDTEMFYWKSNKPVPKKISNEDLNEGNWVEIWNDVFMQYEKNEKGNYLPAKQKNIDTGMGLERTLAILNGFEDNYLTEVWRPIIKKIERLSNKKYGQSEGTTKEMRIIADHIKASVFIIADGITPSNTEQGYVLRRLIRRAIVYGKNLNLKNFTDKIAEPVFEIYEDYKNLKENKKQILNELKKEEDKFNQTLEKGINLAEKMANKRTLSGKDAFLLFQSYSLPIEVTKEIVSGWGSEVDEKEFQEELKKHQELSRTASAGKFKSGLADNSEQTTKLHTATHLLLASIKKILKNDSIHQMGSNITPERLRFDFNFPRKLTDEEIKEIESQVNKWIKEAHIVTRKEMSPEEAKKHGATGIFESKYGNKISAYFIDDISKEICTGPHVKNTKDVGKFKITKEESSSSGVRRIKAIVG